MSLQDLKMTGSVSSANGSDSTSDAKIFGLSDIPKSIGALAHVTVKSEQSNVSLKRLTNAVGKASRKRFVMDDETEGMPL